MYDEIRKILLKHRGEKNAITAKEISSSLGLPLEDTQSVCRKAIKRSAEMYELPVVAGAKGYYIAETQKEIDEFNKNIDNRIAGMKKTKQSVNDNFHKDITKSVSVCHSRGELNES